MKVRMNEVRIFKSLWLMVAVGRLMAVAGSRSFVGPLLLSFPAVWVVRQEVAGETTLADTTSGLPDAEIDWIVKFLGNIGHDDAPTLGYFYQIENSATTMVSSFTIATSDPFRSIRLIGSVD